MKRRRHSQKQDQAGQVRTETVAPSSPSRQKFQIFPNYSVHVVLFVVLVGRLSYVTDPGSWWILHPDEIYQVIEVAHTDVYGYGFESSGHQRPLYSEYHMDLTRESMRGIHSWIIPKFYSWALVCKEALKIPTRPYLFCRQLHVVVSGLLPVVIYLLCCNLYTEWPSDVATIAALVVGFGDYFVLLGTHTLPQSFSSTILFAVAALMYRKDSYVPPLDDNDNYALKYANRESRPRLNGLALICGGAMQGVITYIKPDSIALVVVLNMVLIKEWQVPSAKCFLCYITGLAFGWTLGGFFDLIYYGMWFISPVRWWRFEWLHAGHIYGFNNLFYYFETVFLTAGAHAFMALACVIVFIIYGTIKWTRLSIYSELNLWVSENKDSVFMSFKFFICSLILLTIHSVQPHKEMRYLHDALILLSCSGAGSLFCLFQLVRILSASQNQDKIVLAVKLFIYAEAALYAIRACSPAAMKSRFTGMSELVVPETPGSWHVNKCLDFVGRQLDLTGLVLDHPIHLSGGYTILHSNVPIIAKTHFDFREWDMKARINFTSETAFSHNQSLSCFDRISNYVAVENGKLILSMMCQPHSTYNYAILTRNRRFPKQGFREVFRSGNVTVFKKMRTRTAAEYLSGLVNQIPVGSDVSVLQVEASWLIAFGLPSVALQRLERALELDSNCLPCWQLLYGAYVRLGNSKKADDVKRDCKRLFGQEKCSSKTRVIPLHPGYSFGISRLSQPKPIVF